MTVAVAEATPTAFPAGAGAGAGAGGSPADSADSTQDVVRGAALYVLKGNLPLLSLVSGSPPPDSSSTPATATATAATLPPSTLSGPNPCAVSVSVSAALFRLAVRGFAPDAGRAMLWAIARQSAAERRELECRPRPVALVAAFDRLAALLTAVRHLHALFELSTPPPPGEDGEEEEEEDEDEDANASTATDMAMTTNGQGHDHDHRFTLKEARRVCLRAFLGAADRSSLLSEHRRCFESHRHAVFLAGVAFPGIQPSLLAASSRPLPPEFPRCRECLAGWCVPLWAPRHHRRFPAEVRRLVRGCLLLQMREEPLATDVWLVVFEYLR